MAIVVLTIIFVLVFTVSLAALKEHSVFGRSSQFIIAFCIATLSALGLHRVFSGGEKRAVPDANETTVDGTIEGILLLYAAFAVACIFLIVALIIMWLGGRGRRTESTRSGNTIEEIAKMAEDRLRRRRS